MYSSYQKCFAADLGYKYVLDVLLNVHTARAARGAIVDSQTRVVAEEGHLRIPSRNSELVIAIPSAILQITAKEGEEEEASREGIDKGSAGDLTRPTKLVNAPASSALYLFTFCSVSVCWKFGLVIKKSSAKIMIAL